MMKVLAVIAMVQVINFTVDSFSPTKDGAERKGEVRGQNFVPIVANSWTFPTACAEAWEVISSGGSAVDAVERGCRSCEERQCSKSVGYGGKPDEDGETTLDAMIMDGETFNVGAVGALRRVKGAISVARAIMDYTTHTFLVGDQATQFALEMGFAEETLTTDSSQLVHEEWKANKCQPNFWRNVTPNPKTSCGPYTPILSQYPKDKVESLASSEDIMEDNHDTIGMVSIDNKGQIAAGASTNGLRYKIPGRVGDTPIPGNGAYAEKGVGAATATGDGDIMIRFAPSLLTVEAMKAGMSPRDAATKAVKKMADYYPTFSGAVVSINYKGEAGAACNNIRTGYFNYTVAKISEGITVKTVPCLDSETGVQQHV